MPIKTMGFFPAMSLALDRKLPLASSRSTSSTTTQRLLAITPSWALRASGLISGAPAGGTWGAPSDLAWQPVCGFACSVKMQAPLR